ncbi:hypothetical protein [Methylomonas koyamae]|uniref:Uncharacterized protein n=1 Tax=Methylomonas koyamae TaxID=702114 RepID=A0A291IK17_9GAMM|nr:hypothetical protein [Methylomonas koyamae]ATG90531.1 hypothetical protein MKLM6_2308 [Methylomonas koyamae]OAI30061.1 hypothetical protein A1356_22485 [Methylomonas koyamae]
MAKKSSFYHTRWNKLLLNENRAAEVLGVSVQDVQQFDLHGNPLAERVLLLWDRKRLHGEGWERFIFSRGALICGQYRWGPDTLLLWRDQAAEIERLEREIKRLRTWRGLSTVFVNKLVDMTRRDHGRRGL